MLGNVLPASIGDAVNKIPYNSLCELRLRANSPAIVNILGENYYLTPNSLTKNMDSALTISKGEIYSILNKISNNSMYTINDQMLEGYVTISGGIRVGVCGELVVVDGKLKTLKNVSSLNFRFPHLFKNCSLNIYPYIVRNGEVKNTLIVSPPGAGKTTYLRDLVYQLSTKEDMKNILIVDERNEISSVFDGENTKCLKNCDIYTNCSKQFGFVNGIRSMKPDILITDEINIDTDIGIIENALTSGVKVITTIHASSIMDLKNKPNFQTILDKQMFERFVVLSASNGIGTLEGIFNENLKLIGVWWNFFWWYFCFVYLFWLQFVLISIFCLEKNFLQIWSISENISKTTLHLTKKM